MTDPIPAQGADAPSLPSWSRATKSWRPSYVELHARTAFSFLRGASLPEQLAEKAAQLGLPAVAVCDRDGFYGAPRFFAAAREQGVRPIVGAEITLLDGTILPVLVKNRKGYQNLCRLLTKAHLRAPKGEARSSLQELEEFAEGLVALTGDEEGPLRVCLARQGKDAAFTLLRALEKIFGPANVYVELQRHFVRGERVVEAQLVSMARLARLPVLATNGVLAAEPRGRQVLDVFTCLREHTHLDLAGRLLTSNEERYLKGDAAMKALFLDLPAAITETVTLAERLQFNLDDLGYEFPIYPVPAGQTMDSFLHQETMRGARGRYGSISPKVQAQLTHELRVIAKLGFAGYFLIVWDIVNFCRETNVMVQGRGSAANSAVCYSLGITAVDPVGSKLLFERFLSEGRKGWPDIDLDLPSGDRRESVIQEVYRRYGQQGAAMTANVITYRGRSAAREIGKVLNFPNDIIDRFSSLFANGDFPHTLDLRGQMEQAGLAGNHPRFESFVSLYAGLYGLPRHLGQHSGGMIICQGQLSSIVPLENASMPGRVVAQWDKDDCEALGIIKVDLLGLGMMSVLQDAIELTHQRGHGVDLAQIPKDDAATFEIMQRADTIGVFQIESRAQMATLPRMKPACFYDVVIEVAIIRPGPIQGNMVHPYLARRGGFEEPCYYDERLRPVLERTLGVPLFQEQLLKMAMVMANFSGDEAEELRRALSFHRSEEKMKRVGLKLREGMAAQGFSPTVIDQVSQAITSFALYGFPESHAISFAILAYGSAYLKVHFAPEFFASLLNNQPMGFYSSATLVKDAKRHGVKFRPVSVLHSDWRCTIATDDSIRLGFCVVEGLRAESAGQLLAERAVAPFATMADFRRRTQLRREELRTLAEIGAFQDLAAHRRAAMWSVESPWHQNELFSEPPGSKGSGEPVSCPLPPMAEMERLQADYRGTNLTMGPHAMALIRSRWPQAWKAAQLSQARPGQRIQIAGNVICRQRPGTAKGFVFVSLEDETGIANAIVHPDLFERCRLVITQEPFLIIEGPVQVHAGVVLLKADQIEALVDEQLVGSNSHDFH